MKFLIIIVSTLILVGCRTTPPRPNHYPALEYPFASMSDIRVGQRLRLEGNDIGLDGGSYVYILSTPSKRKIQLWNLSVPAKEQRGLDQSLNQFLLVLGSRREDSFLVPVGSELESLLISVLPAEIASGISDRQKRMILKGTSKNLPPKVATEKDRSEEVAKA